MDARTPVLIGAGQFTYRGEPGESPSPTALLKIAAERAAEDAGLPAGALAGIDTLAVVGFTIDAPGGARVVPHSTNPPATLARWLGATPRHAIYSHMGGNSPQQMINLVAERIAKGQTEFALVVGCEFLGSATKRLQRGLGFDNWDDVEDDLPPPDRVGDPRNGVTPYEAAHGLARPINCYPLFENALRARDGRSIPDHQKRLGELFAPFTKVAAKNPEAWFPVERSAEELVTVTDRNRMVGFPYPKYLNAIMEVDQSAGVIVTSLAKARALGVAEDRLVYLHGCADACDLWYPTDRQNFHSSPAMRLTGKRALEMAGIGLDDIGHIDLYSCFPVAVEIGAEELGLALDDPRGLTVTGGLPYMGGPGNNYAMHSIAVMMQRLRDDPGSYGLVTANGWYLTKQSTGIYSTRPLKGAFERQDPKVIQDQIDALPHPAVIERPKGAATIETFTVVHGREGYMMGIVVGRDSEGRRFVANTPTDAATLSGLEATEAVGRKGTVGRSDDDARNIFFPD
ncbi:acetyl-CoA acetyltransferase [Phenylobacterium sp. LH3H17]|uniref:acetyl-CoA acetyltransferase n=1 Tax=Phenylobacterium sp. LH3H17 TaxID=2903901 RepID=UPI0020C96B5A|nr:acetyl-CoA acetyltransferase [Phenylobacterium sp. LH3H17]UTP41533.1 acetyl-CoA acetyltransferase [Phenylobacterium sp. LH3H17]